jgi:hypothetical protein
VIFESNRIVEVVKPDVCLALVGGAEWKGSFDRLLRVADAAVIVGDSEPKGMPEETRLFELEGPDRLSSELVGWLRERLKII